MTAICRNCTSQKAEDIWREPDASRPAPHVATYRAGQTQHLLRLPAEIRSRIWQFVFSVAPTQRPRRCDVCRGVPHQCYRVRISLSPARAASRSVLAALTACRQVHAEAAGLFYRLNLLSLAQPAALFHFLVRLGPAQRASLAGVHVASLGRHWTTTAAAQQAYSLLALCPSLDCLYLDLSLECARDSELLSPLDTVMDPDDLGSLLGAAASSSSSSSNDAYAMVGGFLTLTKLRGLKHLGLRACPRSRDESTIAIGGPGSGSGGGGGGGVGGDGGGGSGTSSGDTSEGDGDFVAGPFDERGLAALVACVGGGGGARCLREDVHLREVDEPLVAKLRASMCRPRTRVLTRRQRAERDLAIRARPSTRRERVKRRKIDHEDDEEREEREEGQQQQQEEEHEELERRDLRDHADDAGDGDGDGSGAAGDEENAGATYTFTGEDNPTAPSPNPNPKPFNPIRIRHRPLARVVLVDGGGGCGSGGSSLAGDLSDGRVRIRKLTRDETSALSAYDRRRWKVKQLFDHEPTRPCRRGDRWHGG